MTTTRELVTRFRRYLDSATQKSEGTKWRYVYEVQAWLAGYAGRGVAGLTPADILAWNAALHDAQQARGTIGLKRAAVRCFLDYLDFWEQDRNAATLLTAMERLQNPPDTKLRRETFALSEADAQKLLAAAAARIEIGPRDKALIHFLYSAATRRAEARGLVLEDLDLTNRLARVIGKGNKERVVAFTEACRGDLKQWLEVRASWNPADSVREVFISVTGTRLNVNTIGTIIRETGQRARLDRSVWTHILRHTGVTRLMNTGASLQGGQKFFGHASPATTAGYIHMRPEEIRDWYDAATRRFEEVQNAHGSEGQGYQGGPDNAVPGRSG